MLGSASCDRNLEPIVPGELPSQPDLSRIFPEPAESDDHAPADQTMGARAADRGSPIRGTVELAAELASEAPAGSVLFIMARSGTAVGGPPLAVARIPDPRFPLEFEIGPGQMMSADAKFEGEFTLTARLDLDGNAMSRLPGDLEGTVSGPVPAGSQAVVLVLDSRV